MKVLRNTLLLLIIINLFSIILSDDVEDKDSELNNYRYTTEQSRDEKSITKNSN